MRKTRSAPSYKRIAFVASDVPAAQRARRRLVQHYGDVRPETADVVVALGGDGLLLATLPRFMNSGEPAPPPAVSTATAPSTKFRCSARATRRRGCASWSTARSVLASSSRTV